MGIASLLIYINIPRLRVFKPFPTKKLSRGESKTNAILMKVFRTCTI